MDMRIKRGQILKKLRIKKGLKQSDLAEIMGITQQAYQRYEYGTSEPNADGFAFLADFYGVTIDYLLGREDTSVTTQSELEHQIVEAYFKLEPEDRAKILEVMLEKISEYAPDFNFHEVFLMEIPESMRGQTDPVMTTDQRLEKRRKHQTLQELKEQQEADAEEEAKAKKDA